MGVQKMHSLYFWRSNLSIGNKPTVMANIVKTNGLY